MMAVNAVLPCDTEFDGIIGEGLRKNYDSDLPTEIRVRASEIQNSGG